MRGISLLPIRSLNFIGSLGFCTVLPSLIFLVTALLLPGNRRPWQEPRS